jgi:hypothetical protein
METPRAGERAALAAEYHGERGMSRRRKAKGKRQSAGGRKGEIYPYLYLARRTEGSIVLE